jgi:DNA invertase Pin-like site-specific DNA recombinase
MRPAAQYLRMSTEHQRYSLEHQSAAIALYAAAKGFEVVKTYADAGRSGLYIKGRDALRALLTDVIGGNPGFETILVLDVSRWGRFQDTDEGAHYEFICRSAGVPVEYCAELFENDGSLPSAILKNLKRAMAAEFSRELSHKIYHARTNILRRGFWLGGSAGFGLRRQMVSPEGELGAILETGQFKGIQGHHCILVPGPPHEIVIVKRIYRMFTADRIRRATIARILNKEGIPGEGGKPWSRRMVHGVLSNPKYVGDLVGNRTQCYLGARVVRRNPSQWVRAPRVFEPIISRQLFARAQQRIKETSEARLTRLEMLAALRKLHDRHGKITRQVIDDEPGLPWIGIFYREFGGPSGLYSAIGERMPRRPRRPNMYLTDDQILERLRALLALTGRLNKTLIDADPTLPGRNCVAERFCGLTEAYRRIGFKQVSHRERHTAESRAHMAEALERLHAVRPA